MDVFDYIEKELDRIEVGYTSYDGTRLTMSIDDVRELIENLRKKLAQNLPNTCISRQAAIDLVKFECGKWTGLAKTIENGINGLPSAQPEPHEIGYSECANAMLKMWIDNVLTDGEYSRVMDKLNAHWAERREE